MLIHGDAAFAGEGMVQETLNLSELAGYAVGGTLHVIVNNQIGFTTPPEKAARALYATDVAKMLQIPIFHVNGEDPEAVAQVVRLAMDFRAELQARRGHRHVRLPPPRPQRRRRAVVHAAAAVPRHRRAQVGARRLPRAPAGTRRRDARGGRRHRRRARASSSKTSWRRRAATSTCQSRRIADGRLERLSRRPGDRCRTTSTPASSRERLDRRCSKSSAALPDGVSPASQDLARCSKQRREMADGRAAARLGGGAKRWRSPRWPPKAAASASPARTRERGTFSHRHAVLARHRRRPSPTCRCSTLPPSQAPFEIYQQPAVAKPACWASSTATAWTAPDGLVLWEAQFGDFVNAAQVIIDQFIASAEDKWRRLSGLVLLLPHGFEGQGPEHSSARLERFLTLAAEDNIQVVVPDHAGAVFPCAAAAGAAALAQAAGRDDAEEPAAASPGGFAPGGVRQRPLPARAGRRCASMPRPRQRVLLCSGKIYYDLAQAREDTQAQRRRDRARRAALPAGAGAPARRPWSTTRTARRCSGCRKSPRTWERGGTCGSASARSCSEGCRLPGFTGRPRPARLPARPVPTSSSSRRLSTRHSATNNSSRM